MFDQQNFKDKMTALGRRHEELGALLGTAEVINKRAEFLKLSREHADLDPLIAAWKRFEKMRADLVSARQMAEAEADPDLRAMAKEEVTQLEQALVVVLTAACSSSSPAITSCDDRLAGVWLGERDVPWMVLDHGATLEVYPLFDDGHPAGTPVAVETAPRGIDLARESGSLRGVVKRRYMNDAASCDARATATVTRCEGAELELVLADPQPPLSYAPCAWGPPDVARRVRWRRRTAL